MYEADTPSFTCDLSNGILKSDLQPLSESPPETL